MATKHFTESPSVTQTQAPQFNTFSVAVEPCLDGVFPFPGGGEDTHVIRINGDDVAWAGSESRAWEIYQDMLRVKSDHYRRGNR